MELGGKRGEGFELLQAEGRGESKIMFIVMDCYSSVYIVGLQHVKGATSLLHRGINKHYHHHHHRGEEETI